MKKHEDSRHALVEETLHRPAGGEGRPATDLADLGELTIQLRRCHRRVLRALRDAVERVRNIGVGVRDAQKTVEAWGADWSSWLLEQRLFSVEEAGRYLSVADFFELFSCAETDLRGLTLIETVKFLTPPKTILKSRPKSAAADCVPATQPGRAVVANGA